MTREERIKERENKLAQRRAERIRDSMPKHNATSRRPIQQRPDPKPQTRTSSGCNCTRSKL
jgi:hypothetical protein